MKRKILTFTLALLMFMGVGLLAACGNVVPCAWIKLDMEGYIYYSSRMYPGSDEHIQLYKDEEEFNKEYHIALITVTFWPRILGADDNADEVRVTTVDISDSKGVDIKFTVDKTVDGSLYSPEKKVYLNGEVLETTPEYTYNGDVLISWTFKDVTLVRGNPNGQFNNFINKLEYK